MRRRRILGPLERGLYGSTVSALVDGELKTIERFGYPLDALEACIEHLETLGEKIEIVCVSNPETIYTDLQGSRDTNTKTNQGWMKPEFYMLWRIGRLDLASIPMSETAYRERLTRLRQEEKRLRETGSRKPPPQKPSRKHKRATHCWKGHEFTPETTYVNPSNGRRNCRICRQDAYRRRKQNPQAVPAGSGANDGSGHAIPSRVSGPSPVRQRVDGGREGSQSQP